MKNTILNSIRLISTTLIGILLGMIGMMVMHYLSMVFYPLPEGITIEDTDLAISLGSMVRIIREPFFGRFGRVKDLPPQLTKMESETEVRVAEIEFDDGSIEIIPRTNLEMIVL